MPYNARIGVLNGHEQQVHQRFGIEVEVENCPRNPNGLRNSVWSTDTDGSLRDYGREFISKPLAYHEVSEACDQLYRWIRRNGYTGGARCGVHVHVEMNNRTIDETLAFMVAYLLAEPIIYTYCGPAREENIYCIPWYRAPEDVSALMRGHRNRRNLLGCLRDTNKYSGMYLEPLSRFGTAEFRMAPVFNTAQELKWMVSIADSLATYCIGMTPLAVIEEYYNKGAEALMDDIFGRELRYRMYAGDVGALLDKHDVESLADEAAGLAPQLPGAWVSPITPPLQHAVGYYRNGGPIGSLVLDEELDEDDEDDNDDHHQW